MVIGGAIRPMRQLPYFEGGSMTMFKALYSLEESKDPLDDMFSAWAHWLMSRSRTTVKWRNVSPTDPLSISQSGSVVIPHHPIPPRHNR